MEEECAPKINTVMFSEMVLQGNVLRILLRREQLRGPPLKRSQNHIAGRRQAHFHYLVKKK